VSKNPGFRIGIDLGGTKIEGIALGHDGTIAARQRVATPAGDYPATVAAIRDLVATIEARIGGKAKVGIGMPGAVSPATGLVKNANSTCLIGHDLARDLTIALDREVRLDNDANCFALSEASDGAGAGAGVVFGVILGTGVGGGIVVGGKVLRGANAVAGEWGHNPLPWPKPGEYPGPTCYCGRSGCIEAFLSGPNFARDHGTGATAAEIAKAAASGDAAAQASLQRYAERLARGLAGVINILDPDVIVLGGGLSQIEPLYTLVPSLWSRWIFSDAVATKLLPPVHGASSGVRGAAWLWQQGE
jgi:fructokinase